MLVRYLLSSSYVCHSVCLSQAGVVVKRLDESSWFWHGGSPSRGSPSTYPTLCCKEIRASPEIRVLPSRTLSQTPVLENFAASSPSRCQELVVVVVDVRVCWRHLYDNRLVVAVYYRHIVNHIVDTCPLARSGYDAVIWLESTATAALVK